MAGAVREAQDSSLPTTTRGCARPCCRRRAPISGCRPRSTRWSWKTSASIFLRSSSPRWRTRRFTEIQGRDEADRRGDREGTQPALERLSRRDPRAEEGAARRRRDPAFLRKPAEADRKDHRRAADRDACPTGRRRFGSPRRRKPRSSPRRTCSLRRSCTTPGRRASSCCR